MPPRLFSGYRSAPVYSVYGGFILMRIGNWFIIKAITMPIVVSKIRATSKDNGLSSFPCVTVIHRKTTHMRNVPFSRFIKTEKLMMRIRSTDKTGIATLHMDCTRNTSQTAERAYPISRQDRFYCTPANFRAFNFHISLSV